MAVASKQWSTGMNMEHVHFAEGEIISLSVFCRSKAFLARNPVGNLISYTVSYTRHRGFAHFCLPTGDPPSVPHVDVRLLGFGVSVLRSKEKPKRMFIV